MYHESNNSSLNNYPIGKSTSGKAGWLPREDRRLRGTVKQES